ncbi:exopolysaccharide biosynthesis protein [Devosia aurantiaca]|uniref:Exopolysaccharide biosynthesis protein n=1 Tax=Devosia aurantiaca TaxID=2714858 RepID=A0A6M1SCW1_9HYPH|nr:exopolysaccharide biosynthesis protein [Devosia aurantiaca]NGP17537.1 exopolysaccharide biosynthesis protein [Devosia aurantiaca]
MTARAPINRYARRIASALRRAAETGTHLTLMGLVKLLGPKAHRLLLLVAALFNMIPGPPGFGGTIAGTTFLIALAMVLDRPIRLPPPIIGNRKLPLKLLIRASDQVVRVTDILARFSRPRMRWLTGAGMNLPYGVIVMLVSVIMAIPIPFINAIPNVGLCIVAFSMLNRDGGGVIIGLIATAIGVVIDAVIIFGVAYLAVNAMGAMH